MPERGSPCGEVLVVDDDEGVRTLVEELMRAEGLAVTVAESAERALEGLGDEAPCAAILDVHLPGGMSGYELCRALRARYGDAPGVVFISGERRESFDRVAGFLIGGDDYLTKPFAPDELVARVRALLRRSSAQAEREHGLTPREREVLRLLAGGLSQREIAQSLVISSKTVATHIERILTKLGVHSRAEAVAAAYRRALVRA